MVLSVKLANVETELHWLVAKLFCQCKWGDTLSVRVNGFIILVPGGLANGTPRKAETVSLRFEVRSDVPRIRPNRVETSSGVETVGDELIVSIVKFGMTLEARVRLAETEYDGGAAVATKK